MNQIIIIKQDQFEVRIGASALSATTTKVSLFAYANQSFIPPYGFFVHEKLRGQKHHINEAAILDFLAKKNVDASRVRVLQEAESGYIGKVEIRCETPRQIRRAKVVLGALFSHMLELADKPKCSTEKTIRKEFN